MAELAEIKSQFNEMLKHLGHAKGLLEELSGQAHHLRAVYEEENREDLEWVKSLASELGDAYGAVNSVLFANISEAMRLLGINPDDLD